MAGLRLRGGVYWLRVRTGAGQRIETSLKTGDPGEAIRKKAEYLRHPAVVEQTDERLRHQVTRFLAHRQATGWFTRDTADRAESVLANFATFLGNPALQSVTAADVARFYRERKRTCSATTALGQLMKVRSLFRWAHEDAKLIRENPALEVKADRVDRVARKNFCDFDERDRLIRECPRADLRLVLLLGFHVGMRFQEIVQAKRYWFDLKRRVVSLRKHAGIQFKDREEREVPMTSELYAFLANEYPLPREPQAYVLHPEKIRPVKWRYRWDFTRPFDQYAIRQGFCVTVKSRRTGRERQKATISPHTMRHTFASLLLSEEASIYSVAKWMGDEVRTVESNYGHLLPGHDQIERAFTRRRQSRDGEQTTAPSSEAHRP